MRLQIEADNRFVLTGCFHSTMAAFECLENHSIDMLLLDIELPMAVDLVRFVTSHSNKAYSILVCRTASEPGILMGISAGASAYILTGELDRLVEEIERTTGGSALNFRVARRMIKNLTKPPEPESSFTLTGKEFMALSLISKGLSHAEMAQVAGISVNTIRTHLRNLFRKLDVHSKPEAINLATKHGWVGTQEPAKFVLNNFLTLKNQSAGGVLSLKELEILELLAKGASYSRAAESTGTTINTVRSHIRSIYKKLEVHSLPEAIYESTRLGVLVE